MKALYKNRLLKLAAHLRTGTLGHDQFDFSVMHVDGVCGTRGCALGECPIIWPDNWCLRPYQYGTGTLYPSLIDIDFSGVQFAWKSAEEFFGLTEIEAYELFHPTEDNEFTDEDDSDGLLAGTSTKEEVAANIEAFVATKTTD